MESFDFLSTMAGPLFLWLYVAWFVLIWLAALVARKLGWNSALITLFSLGLFEGVGVARYLIGEAAGLHRWTYLIIMMIFGGMLLLTRADSVGGGSSGDGGGTSIGGGCGSSGGGGGCGSSCGGGGCGGCGGS